MRDLVDGKPIENYKIIQAQVKSFVNQLASFMFSEEM